jgi:prepilin-type N-terminal cleavage/methylation domain-containing protein
VKKRTEGFTLLEVLAAVAILGIWFVVLASVGVQGLRAEGNNERRLRASLLADMVLGEIELALLQGEVPAEGEESERDGFEVRIDVLPLADLELEDGEPDLRGVLAAELPQLGQALYAITVEVAWLEVQDEFRVRRNTYGWDSASLREALGAEDPPATDTPEETQ